jgi:hypothetical protein
MPDSPLPRWSLRFSGFGELILRSLSATRVSSEVRSSRGFKFNFSGTAFAGDESCE